VRKFFWFRFAVQTVREEITQSSRESNIATRSWVKELQENWVSAFVQQDEVYLYDHLRRKEEDARLQHSPLLKRDLQGMCTRAETDVWYSPGVTHALEEALRRAEKSDERAEKERQLREAVEARALQDRAENIRLKEEIARIQAERVDKEGKNNLNPPDGASAENDKNNYLADNEKPGYPGGEQEVSSPQRERQRFFHGSEASLPSPNIADLKNAPRAQN
jgi:replicative superfamily II helicase